MVTATGLLRCFGILHRSYLSYVSKNPLRSDMTYADSILLVNIAETDGVTQKLLVQSLAIDKASVARSVKRLAGTGLVEVRELKRDRRVKVLRLTEEGGRVAESLRRRDASWVEYVMQAQDPDERERLVLSLKRMSGRAIAAHEADEISHPD